MKHIYSITDRFTTPIHRDPEWKISRRGDNIIFYSYYRYNTFCHSLSIKTLQIRTTTLKWAGGIYVNEETMEPLKPHETPDLYDKDDKHYGKYSDDDITVELEQDILHWLSRDCLNTIRIFVNRVDVDDMEAEAKRMEHRGSIDWAQKHIDHFAKIVRDEEEALRLLQ